MQSRRPRAPPSGTAPEAAPGRSHPPAKPPTSSVPRAEPTERDPRAASPQCRPRTAHIRGRTGDPAATGGPAPPLRGRSRRARPSRCSSSDVITRRRSSGVGTRSREDVSDAGAFQFARGADAVYGEPGLWRPWFSPGASLSLPLPGRSPDTEGFTPPRSLLPLPGLASRGSALAAPLLAGPNPRAWWWCCGRAPQTSSASSSSSAGCGAAASGGARKPVCPPRLLQCPVAKLAASSSPLRSPAHLSRDGEMAPKREEAN